jgi:hypothetical protein
MKNEVAISEMFRNSAHADRCLDRREPEWSWDLAPNIASHKNAALDNENRFA